MSRSKKIGSAAEGAVRDALRFRGWSHAERLPTEGSKDRGDITGVDPSIVIEVKACKTMDLGGWMREVEVEKENAGAVIGVVWHKRRGKANPSDWYVTMSGRDFMELLMGYTS